MAKVLNYEAQIETGQVIQPWHISQSVDALTGAEAYDITISGSLVTTGSIEGTTTLTVGSNHSNLGTLSTIAGGINNSISSSISHSFIGGGANNDTKGKDSTIGGGFCNLIDGNSDGGTIAGGGRNGLGFSCSGVISGGAYNTTMASFTSIGGGCNNYANGTYSRIGGGLSNNIPNYSQFSYIGGGHCNQINGSNVLYGTIAGGQCNTIAVNTCTGHFIGGGRNNTISGFTNNSGILGGTLNTVNHSGSFIVGTNITSDKDCTTFVNNIHVTGSTTADGILQLSRRDTTPTGVEGMIIASGSAGASSLYYYNGSTWNALF